MQVARLSIPGYVIDASNPGMVKEAKDEFIKELMFRMQTGTLFESIETIDDGSEEDIPKFLTEKYPYRFNLEELESVRKEMQEHLSKTLIELVSTGVDKQNGIIYLNLRRPKAIQVPKRFKHLKILTRVVNEPELILDEERNGEINDRTSRTNPSDGIQERSENDRDHQRT